VLRNIAKAQIIHNFDNPFTSSKFQAASIIVQMAVLVYFFLFFIWFCDGAAYVG
jgi:hypothetical protein